MYDAFAIPFADFPIPCLLSCLTFPRVDWMSIAHEFHRVQWQIQDLPGGGGGEAATPKVGVQPIFGPNFS